MTNFTSKSPAEVMAEVASGADELDSISKKLSEAIRDQGKVDSEYELKRSSERIKILNEYKGQRLPAEDVRTAMVVERLGGLYEKHLYAAAEVTALKARLKGVADAVSARQSLLAALKEEVRAGAFR